MPARGLNSLPAGRVRQILFLRTAQAPQVQRALDTLRARYPEARISVLGTQLESMPLFRGMDHFEISEAWISPGSVRPLRKRLRREAFDMVVMCLNSDGGAGYRQVSRVVRMLDARLKWVAGYDGRWHKWNHNDFEPSSVCVRGLINLLGLLIYPAIAIYLLVIRRRPCYLPDGQNRPAPEYDA